jgi:hypothetical protein
MPGYNTTLALGTVPPAFASPAASELLAPVVQAFVVARVEETAQQARRRTLCGFTGDASAAMMAGTISSAKAAECHVHGEPT